MPRDTIQAVDDEERHPIAAECTEPTNFLIDVGRVIVTFEHPANIILGDTDLGGQSDERVRVVENLSLYQLCPKETLVQLCTESVRFGQVCQAVRRRRCSRLRMGSRWARMRVWGRD